MDEVARLALQWNLTLGERLPGATCSDVFLTDEGTVLKVPHIGSEERDAVWAAQAFSLHGGVEILTTSDPDTDALLMPRLGIDLIAAPVSEHEKIKICAKLILRLRETPLDARAPSLGIWFKEPLADCHPLQPEGWKEATYLLDTAPGAALLHGDLHHQNILLGPQGWTSIDAKGMAGDPAFEPCAYMRNPIGGIPDGEALAKLMVERLRLFAEFLPYEPRRIWGWSFAQTVYCNDSPHSEWAGQQWSLIAEALWDVRREFLN